MINHGSCKIYPLSFLIIVLSSIILLSIILSASFSYGMDYSDKKVLISSVRVSDQFDIIETGPDSYVTNVSLALGSYPKTDYRQQVNSIILDPSSGVIDSNKGLAYFTWRNPTQRNYEFSILSEVQTSSSVSEITQKTGFPITSLDNSFYSYTQPTATIDVTPDIKALASDLAYGKDDLYDLEYTFAEYVRKNVNYDLSTLATGADQKSSWVLANKRGVCDEITNLFISLNRAVGVPVRFVSGVAYTNLDIFESHFVPHAWAEVYFPGYGWVPYDVTYGQYGSIDAGHIKFGDSFDAKGSNVKYEYVGNNINLEPNELKTDVTVLSYGANEKARYDFTATLYKPDVGFGSYNIVEVQLNNPQSFYQVADIYLADTESISIIEESLEKVLNKTIHRKEVLLKPKSSETVYWIIRVSPDLDRRYVYTFPIAVYDSYNESSVVNMFSRNDYDSLDKDYAQNIISSKVTEQSKSYSSHISLTCTPDKNELYLDESLKIECLVSNKGDEVFSNVSVCIDEQCSLRGLAIEDLDLAFNKTFSTLGLKNIAVKLDEKDFSKTTYVSVNVLDRPIVNITKIIYPDSVNFDDTFAIKFNVLKVSGSNPKNVYIKVQSPIFEHEWNFEELSDERSFTIESNGRSLRPGLNPYNITITYEDDQAKKYSIEESIIIKSNANFVQSIALWFNVIGHWIESL